MTDRLRGVLTFAGERFRAKAGRLFLWLVNRGNI